MPWPTGTISNANVDAATDSPANARGDLNSLIDKVNSIITSQPKVTFDSAPIGISFDLKPITTGVEHPLGPTGSGAANIWTALDSIPSESTHIIVSLKFFGASYVKFKARVYGDLSSSRELFEISATGVTEFVMRPSPILIPVSTRRFDLSVERGTFAAFSGWDMFLMGHIK